MYNLISFMEIFILLAFAWLISTDRKGRITGRAIGPRDWNSDDAKELIKNILSK